MGRGVNDCLYVGMTIATLLFFQRPLPDSPRMILPLPIDVQFQPSNPNHLVPSFLTSPPPLVFLLIPVLFLPFPSQSSGLIAWLVSEANSPFAFPHTPSSSYLVSPFVLITLSRPHRPPTHYHHQYHLEFHRHRRPSFSFPFSSPPPRLLEHPSIEFSPVEGLRAMSTTTESRTEPPAPNQPSPAPSATGSTGTSGITVRNGPGGQPLSFRR